jgi:hypothetical protein
MQRVQSFDSLPKISVQQFSSNKPQEADSRHTLREEQRKKAYIRRELWLPPLFLFGALWEEILRTTIVVDGWIGIDGAHRNLAMDQVWK